MKKTSSVFRAVSTRENISIDVSITTVGLILKDPEKNISLGAQIRNPHMETCKNKKFSAQSSKFG